MNVFYDGENIEFLNSILKGCNYKIFLCKKINLKKKIFNKYVRTNSIDDFLFKINNESFIVISDFNDDNINFYIDNFYNYSIINNYNKSRIEKTKIIFYKNKDYFHSREEFIFKSSKNNSYLKKIYCKAIIMPHWGWTDIILSISLINYYSKQFNDLKIIGLMHQQSLLKSIFPNFKIYFINNPDGGDLDLLVNKLKDDHFFINYGHQSSQCLGYSLKRVNNSFFNKFVNLIKKKSLFLNLNTLNLNKSFINNIHKIKKLDKYDKFFDERIFFYESAYLDKDILFKFFYFQRNKLSEKKLFNNKVKNLKKKYNVIHSLNANNPLKDHEIYLNNICDNIIDSLKILENANKIYFYDSVYGMLIYLSYFSNFIKFKGDIYFNISERSKILKFFDKHKINSQNNWHLS